MRHTFAVEEMRTLDGLAEPFTFTKGCRTMRIGGRGGVKGKAWQHPVAWQTLLFDRHADPRQEQPLAAPATERRMADLLVKLLREGDAPPEQYIRLGLQGK